jgi:sigma-B regulation protein RsbU (phosphoserine phosphatase)
MATEVQQRLFPEHAPESPSAEFAGVCFPARGVGGDYYDFLLLDDERIGVAVADVAGKGISAALLMSTVQASLRSYAPIAASNEAEVTDLVHSMNSLLYGATAANSYATFFYAQFDEQTRQLTYVNAGHNPPLLIRKSDERDVPRNTFSHTNHASAFGSGTAAVLELPSEQGAGGEQWLTTGGPVIGIFERCDYEQETLSLRAGDVLIAYTDGVTEALNPAGEEYGEAQLRDEVSSCAEQTAQQITNCLVAKLRDWCKDMPQHDDITLVVMKVK